MPMVRWNQATSELKDAGDKGFRPPFIPAPDQGLRPPFTEPSDDGSKRQVAYGPDGHIRIP